MNHILPVYEYLMEQLRTENQAEEKLDQLLVQFEKEFDLILRGREGTWEEQEKVQKVHEKLKDYSKEKCSLY